MGMEDRWGRLATFSRKAHSWERSNGDASLLQSCQKVEHDRDCRSHDWTAPYPLAASNAVIGWRRSPTRGNPPTPSVGLRRSPCPTLERVFSQEVSSLLALLG